MKLTRINDNNNNNNNNMPTPCIGYCCGRQIRPVEEQPKQRVIGERYCLAEKGSHTKEVLAVLGLQSVKCLVRNEKFSTPSDIARRICFGWTSPSLGYGRICPHNNYLEWFIQISFHPFNFLSTFSHDYEA